MKQVVRGFCFEAWRFEIGQGGALLGQQEQMYQCDVAATGPLLQEKGHYAALDLLHSTVGAWLQAHWANRFLLRGGDAALRAAARRIHPVRAPFVLPGRDRVSDLAEFLLLRVCEPQLRGTGLLAHSVQVRRGAEPPFTAEIAPQASPAGPQAKEATAAAMPLQTVRLKMEASPQPTPAPAQREPALYCATGFRLPAATGIGSSGGPTPCPSSTT